MASIIEGLTTDEGFTFPINRIGQGGYRVESGRSAEFAHVGGAAADGVDRGGISKNFSRRISDDLGTLKLFHFFLLAFWLGYAVELPLSSTTVNGMNFAEVEAGELNLDKPEKAADLFPLQCDAGIFEFRRL